MTSWATRGPIVRESVDIPRAEGTARRDTAADHLVWVERIDQLLAIRQLEDDWDGQGTAAPATAVVDSALILALLLRQDGIAGPNLVTQGLGGEVHFDWLTGDGKYIELQVTAPQTAFIYVHSPGHPVQQFALDGAFDGVEV